VLAQRGRGAQDSPQNYARGILDLDLVARCEDSLVEPRSESPYDYWLAGRGILDRPMLDPALAHQARQRQNALMAALLRIIARRPVVAFMVIGP